MLYSFNSHITPDQAKAIVKDFKREWGKHFSHITLSHEVGNVLHAYPKNLRDSDLFTFGAYVGRLEGLAMALNAGDEPDYTPRVGDDSPEPLH